MCNSRRLSRTFQFLPLGAFRHFYGNCTTMYELSPSGMGISCCYRFFYAGDDRVGVLGRGCSDESIRTRVAIVLVSEHSAPHSRRLTPRTLKSPFGRLDPLRGSLSGAVASTDRFFHYKKNRHTRIGERLLEGHLVCFISFLIILLNFETCQGLDILLKNNNDF